MSSFVEVVGACLALLASLIVSVLLLWWTVLMLRWVFRIDHICGYLENIIDRLDKSMPIPAPPPADPVKPFPPLASQTPSIVEGPPLAPPPQALSRVEGRTVNCPFCGQSKPEDAPCPDCHRP